MVRVGRFSYGIENLKVKQWGEGASLQIGSFCSIASATIFLGGNHRTDWITTFPFGHVFVEDLGNTGIMGNPYTNGNVVIGNDVWIGDNVTIMSGVNIGDGAIIAANTHVVKNVKPYSIAGGNPARTIGLRFSPEVCDLLIELSWWDLPLDFIKKIAQILSSPPDVEKLRFLINKSKEYIQ